MEKISFPQAKINPASNPSSTISNGISAIREFSLESLIAFLAGATAAALEISLLLAIVFTAVGVVWLHSFRKKRTLMWMLALGTFLFGFAYYHFYIHAVLSAAKLPGREPFTAVIAEDPSISGNATRFMATLQNPYRGEVEVVSRTAVTFTYGDLLLLQGKIQNENGELVLLYPQITIAGHNKGNWLESYLYGIKHAVVQEFKQVLAPDQAAFLGGVTLGARNGFSKELNDAMKLSGTIHIVAVSGSHISTLVINLGILAAFFVERKIAIWIVGSILFLFVGMVGTQASVVRAAIMGILALLGEYTGRPNNQAYMITLAAALMVAWNPTVIRNDLGFSLSFLSLLGVTYIAPALRSFWREAKDKGILAWKENLDTTVGAQLGVLPILLGMFGKISLTSIFANILILPVIPFTMGIGFALGILQWISPILAFPVTELARALTWYETAVIQFFARFAAPVGNFFSSLAMMGIYYAVLVLFVIWRMRKNTTVQRL